MKLSLRVQLVSFEVLGIVFPVPCPERRTECGSYSFGYRILNLENISAPLVELISPQLFAVTCPDQFSGNSDTVVCDLNTAIHYRFDAECEARGDRILIYQAKASNRR